MKAQLRVRSNLTVADDLEKVVALHRPHAEGQVARLALAALRFPEYFLGGCQQAEEVHLLFGFQFHGCRAVLSMGVHRGEAGTLFPRRHTEAGDGVKEWLPDNGWLKWDPEAERMV